MTQMTRNQSYLLIEDRLDLIGQKYRIQRLVRGFMLFAICAIVSTVAACFAAHFLREGHTTTAVTAVWGALLIAAAIFWIVRPLMLRPKNVEMARLIERRVKGLHNGLTNSVLLASRDDIASSPFLPQIFDEILTNSREMPLNDAVKLSDLNPLALRLGIVAVAAIAISVMGHAALAHGWHQMFAPSSFVPVAGTMEIIQVQPGDTTLVQGQPLEISVIAKGPESPDARLVFDGNIPEAKLVASPGDDGQLNYSYRLDHVDAATRYRVKVGSTQSMWYTVSVVHQIKLTGMDFKITPPFYTKVAASTLNLKPDELDKTPITVPQGSMIDIGASVDIPVKRAMLQIGDSQQVEMEATQENHRFHQTITVLADTTISVGLMEGEEIIAKLPDAGLVIHCKNDDAPKVAMIFPSQDGTAIPPTQDLTINATLSDDYGLTGGRVLMGAGDAPPTIVAEMSADAFATSPTTLELKLPIHLTADQSKNGQSIHVQVETTDNRNLIAEMKAMNLSGKDMGGP